MHHLVKMSPNHCRLATGEQLLEVPTVEQRTPLHFGTEIPHFLIRKGEAATMIVPSSTSLATGDVLVNEYGGEVMVTEIVERRKARGNWSQNPFDSSPDFVRVTVI
jgi:hypothetical protein